jgi:hypothetical protein
VTQDYIKSVNEFGEFYHLSISSLLIIVCLSIFLSLLKISFSNAASFSVYEFCASFVKFIPNYFILFDVIVNRIVFLISF